MAERLHKIVAERSDWEEALLHAVWRSRAIGRKHGVYQDTSGWWNVWTIRNVGE